MKRSVCVLAGAVALATPAFLSAQTKSALEADAIAFGTREAVGDADVSPDGSKAVFVGAGPGRTTVVYIADIVAGTTKPIAYSNGEPENFQWCGFVSDTRLACKFTAMLPSERSGMVAAGLLIGVSRLVSLDLEGKDMKQLGQRGSDNEMGLRQHDGEIIDWLPNGGDHVLMTQLFLPEVSGNTHIRKTKRGIGVVKINTRTLSTDIVEQPRENAGLFMSDRRGNVRLMSTGEVSAEAYATGRYKYLYRTQSSREWRPLTDYVDREDFRPLAIDPTINALFALRKLDGRMALVRFSLDDSPVEAIVARHPRVDISNVVRTGDGRVIGYSYSEDYRHVEYIVPEYKNLAGALGRALPKHPLVSFLTSSDDGKKLLLFAGSDRDPGRYHLLDRPTKSLGELVPARPALSSRALAEVKPVTYTGADGTVIPAYLTVPAGKEAKGLPAVVLPHGGPSSRDEWGFDWLSQFLAARGYAVIQPQYRGSAGFGDSWLADNGFKGWRTSVGDITAAARYLTAEGIAAPGRVAIVGWSYGGYAALQAAATDPSVFKAVAAVAPVTDLGLLKAESRDYSNYKVVSGFVGSGPHLEEGSPVRNARGIQVPVLLVHGDMDLNVRSSHSKRMHSALQGAGKQSELLEFKGLDHYLDDSQARALMLTKIGALLERTIGK